MEWQTRRKVLYFLSTIVLIFAGSIYMLRDVLFPEPTCFDKKQNGLEAGIDCGQICGLRCSSEVMPLTVSWARGIQTSSTTYDLVGMVSNKNIDHASHYIKYVFIMYNEKGRPIQNIPGTTIAPINGDFPIIQQSVSFSEKVKNVVLKIEDGPHFNVNEKPTSPTVSISDERYEPGQIPRVYVVVHNRKRMTIRDLPIKLVLFDQYNNAYAVGSTLVPELSKEESKVVSFTWPAPLPYAPVRIRAYPIFDPFLAAQ